MVSTDLNAFPELRPQMDNQFPGPPDPLEGSIVVKGYVKWFDDKKGYGFIVTNDLPADVLIHLSCLKQAGLNTAQEGAKVECEVVKRNKGFQAARLIQLENGPVFPVNGSGSVGLGADSINGSRKKTQISSEGPLVEAIVKWFSRPKGFGFVNRGSGEDIFVHMEMMRACGIREIKPGQRVAVRLVPGPKGQTASFIQIVSSGSDDTPPAPVST
jgi:CspA family cold shock protein